MQTWGSRRVAILHRRDLRGREPSAGVRDTRGRPGAGNFCKGLEEEAGASMQVHKRAPLGPDLLFVLTRNTGGPGGGGGRALVHGPDLLRP